MSATRPVSHTLDIYGDTLHLATTRRAARTLAKRYELEVAVVVAAVGSTTPVIHSRTGERHVVIWIDVQAIDRPRDLIDTLAHEASHAADFIADRGLDNEARAYLVGWITGWLWEQVGDAMPR